MSDQIKESNARLRKNLSDMLEIARQSRSDWNDQIEEAKEGVLYANKKITSLTEQLEQLTVKEGKNDD